MKDIIDTYKASRISMAITEMPMPMMSPRFMSKITTEQNVTSHTHYWIIQNGIFFYDNVHGQSVTYAIQFRNAPKHNKVADLKEHTF